jgi:hypothetical protein
MKMRDLINLIEQNEQSASADTVDQLVSDIKAGKIAKTAIAAISAYIQKHLRQAPQPEQPAPQPEQPAPQPVSAPAKAQPVAPVQPPMPTPPVADTETQLQEAAMMQLPPGVTLKPDELRKIFEKGGFKREEVNNIITFTYRHTIETACASLAAMKQYKKDAGPMIAQLFFEVPGTLSQRNDIAQILLKGGLLNLKKLTQAGKGVLDDLFLPEFRTNAIAMDLKFKLKNRSDFPTQVSAANKGAGEDLITILGNPVNKLSPGDLNIGGKEIEVKAMGARLKGFGGTTVYGDATRIYPLWANDMTLALGATGMEFLQSRKASLKKYFNFGIDNLNILSDAIQVSKEKDRGQLVQQAFTLLLETLYVQSDTAMRSIILRSFDAKTGCFDPAELRKNWFLFSYDYYKKTTADKKTGATMHAIMFINQVSEAYQIVTEFSQIDSEWENYELSTDLFTWNNPTGVAPKITLGKETRERKTRKKAVPESPVQVQPIAPVRERRANFESVRQRR